MDIDWEKIKRAFEARVVKRRCPACASEDVWGGASAITKLQVVEYERHNGAPSTGGESVVFVPVHCPACGYTMLFELTALLGDG